MEFFVSPATTATGARQRVDLPWLKNLILNEHLVIRFVSLFTLGAAAFLTCQTIAYLWLPEGLLRGGSLSTVVAGDEAASSLLAEWARIVGWNLPMLLVFYVATNLIRLTNGVPLGYFIVVQMQAYFGVITGTNSFTMASETDKIAPSLDWLAHPGFYEILAYALQPHMRSADGKTSKSTARRRQSGSMGFMAAGAVARCGWAWSWRSEFL